MACHATIAASTATRQQEEYLMAKTADTIAIYSRKSRYTGKGESIGNQIDLFLQAENDSEPSFPVHIV